MPAAPFTLTFHAGQLARKRWRVGPRGTPWDLTGWGLRSQARTAAGVLVADFGPHLSLADAGTRIVLALPPAVTGLFVAGGCYRWDLWADAPDGSLSEPLLSGPVAVLPSWTRATP